MASKKKVIVYKIPFSILFIPLIPLYIFAQSQIKIQPNGHLLNTNSRKILPNLKNIDLAKTDSSGKWAMFKNWNEGTSVVAENDSIIWVGTSVGLVRWNILTNNYQTFDETNGLNYTSVTSLAFDHKGQLWIGTGQGLVNYTNGVFTYYNYQNSPLPNVGITHIVIDSQDKIYAGVDAYIANNQWNIGFVVFNGASWKTVNLPIDGWVGPLWALQCYHDTVFVSCGYTQIYRYTSSGLEKDPDWPSGSSAISFAVDFQDSLWAVSNMVLSNGRQLLKLSNNKWQPVLGITVGESIWNDPRGGLWISTYRLDIKTLTLSPVSALTDYSSHFAVNSNNQFFATHSGLVKFNGSQWTSYNIPLSLLENSIYGLGVGPQGEVYVSSGLYTQKTNGVTWQTTGDTYTGMRAWNNHFRNGPDGSVYTNHHQVYPNHDSYSGYVTGLDFDSYGNLWVAYPLREYKWPNFTYTDITYSTIGYTVNPEYMSPQFMDVTVDKDDHVWSAAWYYGGAMFDRTNWHLLPPSDTTLPNGNYDLVFADSKNRIWFCTNQWSPNYGFTIYDGKNWRTYSSSQRYGISYVYQIAEDHLGNVWLATGGGLLKYDGASFTIFDSDNTPLNTNNITAVTIDFANNVWVGTKSGLYVYNPVRVQLGPYTYSSPVDSFSLSSSNELAIARLNPHQTNSGTARYELQRGRGTFKFWTVTSSDFIPNSNHLIELRDTSAILGKYYYRIKKINENGTTAYSSPLSFTGVKRQVPSTFTVSANYPNPFNGSTSLDFFVPTSGSVILRFYDILGREVLPSFQKLYSTGYQTIQLDFSLLSTGIYFCSVEFNNHRIIKKVTLLK